MAIQYYDSTLTSLFRIKACFLSVFYLSFAYSQKFVRSHYSSPYYYRQPASTHVCCVLCTTGCKKCSTRRAHSCTIPFSPWFSRLLSFPFLAFSLQTPPSVVTLVAGCPKYKMSRFTAAVRRILINDAMTISTQVGRLMVTLSHGVTSRCKSNMGQNVIEYDCNGNDLVN